MKRENREEAIQCGLKEENTVISGDILSILGTNVKLEWGAFSSPSFVATKNINISRPKVYNYMYFCFCKQVNIVL